MAGIYIHIPFCKRRCTYCDFYTEVATKLIPDLIRSITKEIDVRKDYLGKKLIKTIYFGGGTPSVLNKEQFSEIFEKIYDIFQVDQNAEITFEANPDDLSLSFLESIKSLPFNRISIGIQSFEDTDLKRINRRHTAKQAIEAVKNVQNAGFKNISIDLIYGLPNQSLENWMQQLDIAFSLGVQHISAYGLTYEEGTVLWNQRENGEIQQVDDDTMNAMYLLLRSYCEKYGFEAYEISNFALPGYRSQHNTSYWKQESYLGLGPSAHSYDLKSRQWNIASISDYIKLISTDSVFYEKEELSLNDQYNDYVMVSLRTSDGLNFSKLDQYFGSEFSDYFLNNIKAYLDTEKVVKSNDIFTLTPQGIQISNQILINLIKV